MDKDASFRSLIQHLVEAAAPDPDYLQAIYQRILNALTLYSPEEESEDAP